MPRHTVLTRTEPVSIRKNMLLQWLRTVDNDARARGRVLALETEFRRRININTAALPTNDAIFAKFKTNPFVLMMHSKNKGYRSISEIESDILPAKVFSSLETSSGKYELSREVLSAVHDERVFQNRKWGWRLPDNHAQVTNRC